MELPRADSPGAACLKRCERQAASPAKPRKDEFHKSPIQGLSKTRFMTLCPPLRLRYFFDKLKDKRGASFVSCGLVNERKNWGHAELGRPRGPAPKMALQKLRTGFSLGPFKTTTQT